MSGNKHYFFEDIGSFDLTQPIMRVSDPCYKKDVWCSRTLPCCKTGSWEAAVARVDSDTWGHRIAALAVRHIDGPSFNMFAFPRNLPGDPLLSEYGVSLFEGEVGVDSGQCGFFDEQFYGDDDICKGMELNFAYGDPWYRMCCDVTLSKEQCGVVPYGTLSSSGVGDGGYSLFYVQKNGVVVAAMLQFMEPNK